MITIWRYRFIFLALSSVVILTGLFAIVRWGYRVSIDFTGGSVFSYRFDAPVEKDQITSILERQQIEIVSTELANTDLTIRAKPVDEQKEASLQAALRSGTGRELTILRSETVGPTIGQEMVYKTLIAAAVGILGILLYVTYAFKRFTFALAAVCALLHDLTVMFGVYALLSRFAGAELDTLFVTAVLTTMSFSVHDTIVTFDKMREYLKNAGDAPLEPIANRAVSETIVRSINNSMTIIFMLLALILFGGETIRFFVIALLVGAVSGTYSSFAVAVPLSIVFEKIRRNNK